MLLAHAVLLADGGRGQVDDSLIGGARFVVELPIAGAQQPSSFPVARPSCAYDTAGGVVAWTQARAPRDPLTGVL